MFITLDGEGTGDQSVGGNLNTGFVALIVIVALLVAAIVIIVIISIVYMWVDYVQSACVEMNDCSLI